MHKYKPVDHYFTRLLMGLLFAHAVFMLTLNIGMLDTWLDEGNYLAKGWWYVVGELTPYSSLDPTLYMPIYFYILGLLQQVFDMGHMVGRTFSVLCAAGVFWMTYSIVLQLSGSRPAALAALAILAGHFFPLVYYATATPYAFISVLSLGAVKLLCSKHMSRGFVWLVVGLIFWALTFARPNMLIFGFVPAMWMIALENSTDRIRLTLLGFTGFFIPAFLTLWLFGSGLVDVFMRTPGIAQIADILGLYKSEFWDMFMLTEGPYDPRGQWSEIFLTLWRHFLVPYPLAATVVAVSVIWRSRIWLIRRKIFVIEPIDVFAMYFVLATLIHFLMSQSYCTPCITPYTNYFIPFSALVGGLLVGHVILVSRENQLGRTFFSLVIFLACLTQLTADRSLLRTQYNGSNLTVVNGLADRLRPILPAGSTVLVISNNPVVAQSVWIAGGVVEPLSMNLMISYRDFKKEVLPIEILKNNPLLRTNGFWNESTLREVIEKEYDWVILHREERYAEPLSRFVTNGKPFRDLLDMKFFVLDTISYGNFNIEILRRTPP
jgi:hypothetical protein